MVDVVGLAEQILARFEEGEVGRVSFVFDCVDGQAPDALRVTVLVRGVLVEVSRMFSVELMKHAVDPIGTVAHAIHSEWDSWQEAAKVAP